MCRNMYMHCKHNICKVLQAKCANGRCMKTHQKIRQISIPKSIQNRCEKDAQTSDAKIMENCANMDSRREPQSRNEYQKYINKSMLQYDIKTGHTSWPRRRSKKAPFNNDNTKPSV